MHTEESKPVFDHGMAHVAQTDMDRAAVALELFPCPHCGEELEMLSIDDRVTCDGCGREFLRSE
ncbi:MAG: hypothetical protein ACE5IE_06615 [Dehalococcoidia bacterium]